MRMTSDDDSASSDVGIIRKCVRVLASFSFGCTTTWCRRGGIGGAGQRWARGLAMSGVGLGSSSTMQAVKRLTNGGVAPSRCDGGDVGTSSTSKQPRLRRPSGGESGWRARFVFSESGEGSAEALPWQSKVARSSLMKLLMKWHE